MAANTRAPVRWWLYGDVLTGDLLMQTPAIRALRFQEPEAEIHYVHGGVQISGFVLGGNRNLDRVHLLDRIPDLSASWLADRFFLTDADRVVHLDPGSAFNWGVAQQKALVQGFGALMGVEVTDLRYDYFMTRAEEKDGQALARSLGDGQPIVVVARHSTSCHSNLPHCEVPNKCVSNAIWVEVAHWLLGEGLLPVAVGSWREEQDERYSEWPGKKLYGLPMRLAAGLLAAARATLGIDNGIRHLAAAAGGHLYCVSGGIGLELIHCVPVRNGQRVFEEYRPLPSITAEHIIAGAKKVL